MSSIDDIIFSPINSAIIVDQHDLLKSVRDALRDHSVDIEFKIDPSVPLGIYMKIVDLVEIDNRIFKAARNLVMIDPGGLRPPGAMTIRNVFERLHRGHCEFYWTAPQATFGIGHFSFNNVFHIMSGLPLAEVSTGATLEWWVLGIINGFVGYGRYYCFSERHYAYDWSITYP